MTAFGAAARADYQALRQQAGARLLERDVLAVSGADAGVYLQGQCSQDLSDLASGSAAWSLILEPDGKLCALVAVARTADERYLLVTEAGFGTALRARLERFRLRTRVTVEEMPGRCVGVRGPRATAVLAALMEAGPGAVVVPAPGGGGGGRGFDLVLEGEVGPGPREVTWCGVPAWEACRIEDGVPAMGSELDGRTIPQEADLVGWTVSLTKGCYTGQELVARLDARGNRVARRLCGLVFDGGSGSVAPSAGALVGAPLGTRAGDAGDAGTVTSASWCPGLDATAALAWVRRAVAYGETVEAVDARGDVHRAQVRLLPLVTGASTPAAG